MLHRRIAPLLLLFLAVVAVPFQSLAQTAEDTKQSIDATLSVPVFKNAIVGVLVKSLDSGRIVYEHNADTALMPASNMKILTGTTAVARLGTTFHFTTALYRTGEITKSGELKGDLYIKGGGDPSFTSLDLIALVEEMKAAGVRKFQGHIIADATVFDDNRLGEGWEWDDEPFYYQAQVSGLNCDQNVVVFNVKPGKKVGDPAEVETGAGEVAKAGIGSTRYLAIRNSVQTVTAGSKTSVTFDRTRGRNEAVMSGTIPLDGKLVLEVLTVEEPALFTATRLFEVLDHGGIRVPKPEKQQVAKGTVPKDATILATHDSQPLPRILFEFLKPSDNLYGECLIKTLGWQKTGTGTWDDGASVIRAFLTESGVDSAGLVLADGSGLSRKDNVTPRLLVGVLEAADKRLSPDARTAFEEGLPVAGVDGTLRSRFRGTSVQGNLHAKTGSLSGVSSLSGYLTTKAGEHLVFSILMNHYTSGGSTAQAHAAQDAIALALMDLPKQ
jgi:PBP4 family serine-type D-alanyl-D-alanine carboxypeptidase